MQNKAVLYAAVVTGLILLIPFLGNAPWTLDDFVVMGILIFSMGLVLDFTVRKVEPKYRLAVSSVVLLTFFLIWMQLAVGLIGKIF